MIIKPKSFTKSYPYAPFLQYKIEWEISIEDGEDYDEALIKTQKMSDDWHKKNTNNFWEMPDESMTGTTTVIQKGNNDDDKAYDELVSHLSTIEYREDALAYLENTPFKFTVAAKNIIQSKPTK